MRAGLLLVGALLGSSTALAQVVDMPAVTADIPAAPPRPAPAPPAPDYADPANWSAGPAGPGAGATLPRGATPAAERPEVDIFFVHPTTFASDTAFNQDVGDRAANAFVDASSIARQASAFSGCCRLFAPRYRQASLKALRGTAAQRDAAYALAYSDIERAFAWYLANHNHGRPFILAGHSQGALHISKLLEQRIDVTALQKRLVAAYIPGMNVAEAAFGLFYKSLGPCMTPHDTGCVLQWNSVLPETDLGPIVARSEAAFIALHGDLPGKQTLCVNPVSVDRTAATTSRERSLGAIPREPGAGPLQPLRAGAVAARCDRGFLVATPDPSLDLKPLPGGSMHYHDIGLFWADVRADAIRRAGQFLQR